MAADDSIAFRSMIRASGLGEVWTHTTDESKFKQYGWRTTTKEDSYSPNTLVGNWCEEKFDIKRRRLPQRLPSQYAHYFDTTYGRSFGEEPKPVSKELLHLAAREPRAFPAAQPEMDPPMVKQQYNSFQTTSRVAYVDPRLRTAPIERQDCILKK